MTDHHLDALIQLSSGTVVRSSPSSMDTTYGSSSVAASLVSGSFLHAWSAAAGDRSVVVVLVGRKNYGGVSDCLSVVASLMIFSYPCACCNVAGNGFTGVALVGKLKYGGFSGCLLECFYAAVERRFVICFEGKPMLSRKYVQSVALKEVGVPHAVTV